MSITAIEERRLNPLLGELATRITVESVASIDSTNSELLRRASVKKNIANTLLVADVQTQGRGRRGRRWFSEQGKSLIFSLLWNLPGANISGLSLLVGLSLAEGLDKFLSTDDKQSLALKWPNDLLLARHSGDSGKLAGVLVELPGSVKDGNTPVIIGVGLNLYPPPRFASRQGSQAAASLEELFDILPEIHQLLAGLIIALVQRLDVYAYSGFAPFITAWQERHLWQGRELNLFDQTGMQGEQETIPTLLANGHCVGVDQDGALLLDTSTGRQRFLAGDTGLREIA